MPPIYDEFWEDSTVFYLGICWIHKIGVLQSTMNTSEQKYSFIQYETLLGYQLVSLSGYTLIR